ncbi:MAG: radical SAM protein [Thermoplasmata archaeon]|nr:MAG: radical SAM protein [Thermoplasmata archaeon]
MVKTLSLQEGMPLGKETPLEVIQKIEEDGLSGGVSDILFYPTYKCNLNCYMCHADYTRDKAVPYLSIEQLKDIFDNVNVTKLFHLGGEPFIRGETMEIIKYFDSKGTNQIITTNGMNITKSLAEELAKLKNLVCVQVSLNGTGDNDNEIRGSPNAFKRTVESIRLLREAGVLVWIHCVILKENIDDLANVVRLGHELGVGTVNFIFTQLFSEEDAKKSREKLKKWLGEDVEIGGYIGEIPYSEEQLINSINDVKEVSKKLGLQVMFFPHIFGEQPELYWRGTLLEQEKPICQIHLMPPLSPMVGPEGDVYGCTNIGKSFGNIKDHSLEEIWDSEPLRALRKGMINEKLLPMCRRCPCVDIIKVSAPKMQDLADQTSWESYLDKLTKVLNELPEVPPILEKLECAPVVFQYHISDHPEFNYWHSFEKDGIYWGMGENTDENKTKIIHTTDLDTLRKVNSGEANPVQATMAGTYTVDGDMTILMACAPMLPLQVKAHGIATEQLKSKK